MKRLVIFASGSGTNAENIIKYFRKNKKAVVDRIFCNNPKAGIIDRARKLQVPLRVFSRKDFYESHEIEKELEKINPDLIILAGFLWLIPKSIIEKFHHRIINIHPALLPDYGGKGFYGNIVHQAVIDGGDKYSGITIHYVNEEFDKGEIIFQDKVEVGNNETSESLAHKIHALEYEYYPKIIEKILSRQK